MAEIIHANTHRGYRPSNGTEGDMFMAEWCERCSRANFSDPDQACHINLRAMAFGIDAPEYPAEWQLSNGGAPLCTAFIENGEPPYRCELTLDMFNAEEPQNG